MPIENSAHILPDLVLYIMAYKAKIDQNFAPTLGSISPQAITLRQIELESCSNPLKTHEGM